MIAGQLGKLTGVPVDADDLVAELVLVLGRLDQVHGATWRWRCRADRRAAGRPAVRGPGGPTRCSPSCSAAAAVAGARPERPRRRRGRRRSRPACPVPGLPRVRDVSWQLLLPGARRRRRRLHRQRAHRRAPSPPAHQRARRRQPGAARPGRGQPRRAACCRASRSAAAAAGRRIGDALGGRTQLHSLVAARRPCALVAARPAAGPGGVPARRPRPAVVVYAAIRLVDIAELVRIAPVPPQRAGAGRSPPPSACSLLGVLPGIAGRRRRCPSSTCCAGSPGRTTAILGLRARPGRHARRRRLPGRAPTVAGPGGLPLRLAAVLRQRRGLPQPRASGAVDARGASRSRWLAAQHGGQRRGRPHRARRPRRAARDPGPAARGRRAGPGQAGPAPRPRPVRPDRGRSGRTGSSPRCRPRWRPTPATSRHGTGDHRSAYRGDEGLPLSRQRPGTPATSDPTSAISRSSSAFSGLQPSGCRIAAQPSTCSPV